ncbi:hypothetical protein MHU86_14114 [Fragilaria crotonensis]|nr:hypothetical protein MHU86_14114 [Fragilaria crotonensis]
MALYSASPGASTTKKTDTHTFNWCATCKRWTTTHTTETHTGISKNAASNGSPNTGSAAMYSLVQDPSVWITEVRRTPDISDILYAFSILPWFVKAVLAVALLPLLGPILWLVDTFIVPILLPIWRLDPSVVITTFNAAILPVLQRICGVIITNPGAFIATPLLWAILTFIGWRELRAVTHPRLDGPAVHAMSRAEYRRHRRELRRQRFRDKPPSIRTEGLHRRYPLHLRSLGHFVRRSQAPTAEERRLRDEIRKIQNRVAVLEQEVRLLSKLNYYDPTMASPWPRQHPVPDMRREGGGHTRQRRSGTPVRPDLHRSSPTVNRHRAAGRPLYGQQTRRTPALYPDRPNSHSPNTVDLNDAYYSPTDPEFHGYRCPEVNIADSSSPSLLERVALLAPSRFRSMIAPDAAFPVIWDSGASVTISPEKLDFVGTISRPSTITQLNGIAKGLRIEGEGKVHWSFHDATGKLRTLELPAYYVPKIRITTAHVNPDNNLPTSQAYRQPAVLPAAKCLNSTITAVNDANFNISEPEKELLRWHYRLLGHMGFQKIQFLMRSGVLTKSNNKRKLHQAACSMTNLPKCAACQYGKQHRRPTPGRTSTVVRDRAGILKDGHLVPGQQVSVDHFISSTKGRLFSSAGKSLDSKLYTGGCLFNDQHASGFIHVKFQTHLTTHKTLMAKEKFELMCRDHCVIPQSYLSDNAKCFTAKESAEKLSLFEQIVRFTGVGAHHHNGNAERSIQTIMSIARTMMLHSAIHWPDIADALLWPMAVQHAIFLHNHMPIQTIGLSPINIFTKSRWQQHKFHDVHVWGCPVHVLHKTIADGKKLPRWAPRSVRCVNMGFLAMHASTVPLVLNPATGYITAQFHVVFDDWFSTISSNINNLPDFNSDAWAKLFGESSYQYPFDHDDATDIQIDADPSSDAVVVDTLNVMDSVAAAMDREQPAQPLPVPPPPQTQFLPTPPDPSQAQHPISSTRETHDTADTVADTILSTPASNVDSIVRTPILPMTPQQLPLAPDLETPRAPTPSPSPLSHPPPTPTSSTRESSTREPLSATDMSQCRPRGSKSRFRLLRFALLFRSHAPRAQSFVIRLVARIVNAKLLPDSGTMANKAQGTTLTQAP